MTKILFEDGKAISLGAISKEEDMKQPGRILINPPPRDGRCEVCGRHISELTPFGGPGDPLIGDFTGERLVKRRRSDGPCGPKALEKAWKEAGKEVPEGGDFLSWFISRYGEEKGNGLYWSGQLYSTHPTWECRDCIGLDDDEYFEAIEKRSKEKGANRCSDWGPCRR